MKYSQPKRIPFSTASAYMKNSFLLLLMHLPISANVVIFLWGMTDAIISVIWININQRLLQFHQNTLDFFCKSKTSFPFSSKLSSIWEICKVMNLNILLKTRPQIIWSLGGFITSNIFYLKYQHCLNNDSWITSMRFHQEIP